MEELALLIAAVLTAISNLAMWIIEARNKNRK